VEKKDKKNNLIQLLKFTLFMVGAALVQIASFALANYVLHIWLWLSNVISIVLSVVFSFTLNRKFTFKEANNVYLAMSLVGLYYLIFTPLSALFVDAFDGKIADWILEGISMVVNFITEYLFNKFIVYRKKKKDGPVEEQPISEHN
jgi:putative flippase GtrA